MRKPCRDEGLELQEKLLELRHKVHGAEHPETLMLMGDVVTNYCAVGRNAEAEKRTWAPR